jgi:hypothetical protein
LFSSSQTPWSDAQAPLLGSVDSDCTTNFPIEVTEDHQGKAILTQQQAPAFSFGSGVSEPHGTMLIAMAVIALVALD